MPRTRTPSTAGRRLATLVTAVTLLAGAAVAAPAASAVGSSACHYNVTRETSTVTVDGVNFRTGPGTGYASKPEYRALRPPAVRIAHTMRR